MSMDAPNNPNRLRNITTKLLFLLFLVMIISHMVVFVLFANAHKSDESRVNRGLMVEQVLHIIQVVATTPVIKRESAVSTIDIPNIDVDINKTAEYKPRFQNVSMWTILRYINHQRKQIQFSLQLDDQQWLNIDAQIVPKSWTLQIILFAIEALLAIGVIFYLWSINRFVVPLRRFSIAANRFGRDLHAPKLPEVGPPEVRHASKAMNNMQDKLRNLIRERTQMLAAISHDLRTPITRLKLRSQFIADQDIRHKNIYDLDEMEAMITETLRFAKEDNERGKSVKLEFASLLSTVCDNLSISYPGIQLAECDERVPILGRPIALKRAFSNIIENAIKYGQVANVQLTIHPADRIVMVSVEDEGPGIKAAHLEQVFTPFFRSDSSRSRETGGTGLGLAVARDIIRAHGGDIQLENRSPKGLRVIITLPLGDAVLKQK